MKKKISILSLMLGILVMPVSCTQDDGPADPADATDGLVPVTLSVNIADGMATRANNSNGDPEAWRCFVQILDSKGNSVITNGHIYETMLLDRNTATIFTKYDVYLNPNEDYTFLFWADERELGDADAPYLEDLTAVNYVGNTVAYTGKAEKKGTGDKKPYTVNCELKHIVTKVTLKTTTDLMAGSEIKVKVPKTYATYNVKEQTFTNQTANGYERTVTLTDDITADATNGTEVCSFYALVDNENQPIRITNGNNQGVYKDVTEVPIGPNKHVILRGDVENAGLTGVTFTASVDEQWGSTIPDLPLEKLDLTKGAINITEDGAYHITSNGATTTNAITVSGNISPKIYISDLKMAVSSGNAISITGGANATIFVMGENIVKNTSTLQNSNDELGAGIYVAQGSTVIIQGQNRETDVLTAGASYAGSGIGSNYNNRSCGNIMIKDVTIYARGAYDMDIFPGIGGRQNCGDITIENATVYAYGTAGAGSFGPAIGSIYGSLPNIKIDGSEIHAYRGIFYSKGNADWIGKGRTYEQDDGRIQGTITETVVYKNSYDCFWDKEIVTGDSQTFE